MKLTKSLPLALALLTTELCSLAAGVASPQNPQQDAAYTAMWHAVLDFGHQFLIKFDGLRRRAKDETILRSELNGLLTLKCDLLDHERGKILRVAVMRYAKYPIPEFDPCLQLPGKPVHADRANVEGDRIEAGILLIGRCDGKNDFCWRF